MSVPILSRSTPATGSIAATGSILTLSAATEHRSILIQLTGTWSATVQAQFSNDNTNWIAVETVNVNSGASSTDMTANGMYYVPVQGAYFRLQCTVYASGTVVPYVVYSTLPTTISIDGGAVSGSVSVGNFASLVRTTSSVSAGLATDKIMNNLTELTPKFAKIDAATSGDNTLVASVTDKKIRVLSLMMVSAGTVTARFESGASGTALSGQMNLIASSGFTLPFNPAGWFETAASTLLNLELSGAISVDGMLTYIEV